MGIIYKDGRYYCWTTFTKPDHVHSITSIFIDWIVLGALVGHPSTPIIDGNNPGKRLDLRIGLFAKDRFSLFFYPGIRGGCADCIFPISTWLYGC